MHEECYENLMLKFNYIDPNRQAWWVLPLSIPWLVPSSGLTIPILQQAITDVGPFCLRTRERGRFIDVNCIIVSELVYLHFSGH